MSLRIAVKNAGAEVKHSSGRMDVVLHSKPRIAIWLDLSFPKGNFSNNILMQMKNVFDWVAHPPQLPSLADYMDEHLKRDHPFP